MNQARVRVRSNKDAKSDQQKPAFKQCIQSSSCSIQVEKNTENLFDLFFLFLSQKTKQKNKTIHRK